MNEKLIPGLLLALPERSGRLVLDTYSLDQQLGAVVMPKGAQGKGKAAKLVVDTIVV